MGRKLPDDKAKLLVNCMNQAKKKSIELGIDFTLAVAKKYHKEVRAICQGYEWAHLKDVRALGRKSPRANAWSRSAEFYAYKTLRLLVDNCECQDCHKTLTDMTNSHCHHDVYTGYPGYEELEYTRILCKECHQIEEDAKKLKKNQSQQNNHKNDIKTQISVFSECDNNVSLKNTASQTIDFLNDFKIASHKIETGDDMKAICRNKTTRNFFPILKTLAVLDEGAVFLSKDVIFAEFTEATVQSCFGEMRRFGFWRSERNQYGYNNYVTSVTKEFANLTFDQYTKLRKLYNDIDHSNKKKGVFKFVEDRRFISFCKEVGLSYENCLDNIKASISLTSTVPKKRKKIKSPSVSKNAAKATIITTKNALGTIIQKRVNQKLEDYIQKAVDDAVDKLLQGLQ